MNVIGFSLLATFLSLFSWVAFAQNTKQLPSAASEWIVSETTSPIDYSPVVIAVVQSEDTPQSSKMQLSVYCRNSQTYLVVTGSTISDRGDSYTLSYSVFGAKPVRVVAGVPPTGAGVAFQGDIVGMLQSFRGEGEVALRLVTRTGSVLEGRFPLNGWNAAKRKIAAACKWPQSNRQPPS
jgi:hypothetical protein